mmetsp:Transcript_24459/g.54360  ORF Transcript_24459/g.54360 Transcript_24459/m.54360 type:complete len:265 (+) Transcript_24459:382-1176(+)
MYSIYLQYPLYSLRSLYYTLCTVPPVPPVLYVLYSCTPCTVLYVLYSPFSLLLFVFCRASHSCLRSRVSFLFLGTVRLPVYVPHLGSHLCLLAGGSGGLVRRAFPQGPEVQRSLGLGLSRGEGVQEAASRGLGGWGLNRAGTGVNGVDLGRVKAGARGDWHVRVSPVEGSGGHLLLSLGLLAVIVEVELPRGLVEHHAAPVRQVLHGLHHIPVVEVVPLLALVLLGQSLDHLGGLVEADHCPVSVRVAHVEERQEDEEHQADHV